MNRAERRAAIHAVKTENRRQARLRDRRDRGKSKVPDKKPDQWWKRQLERLAA